MSMQIPVPEPLVRARDTAVARIAGLADLLPVAVLAHWGIEYEKFLRAYIDTYPRLVREVWGLSSRDDLRRLTERISALEDTIRELEAKVEKR